MSDDARTEFWGRITNLQGKQLIAAASEMLEQYESAAEVFYDRLHVLFESYLMVQSLLQSG